MLPYDGSSPKFVVVMDNCSIHHIHEVSELLEDAGILLIYLPPYSPDLCPIEEAFGYLKSYLKEHEDIMDVFSNPAILLQSAFNGITSKQCQGWISDSRYYSYNCCQCICTTWECAQKP